MGGGADGLKLQGSHGGGPMKGPELQAQLGYAGAPTATAAAGCSSMLLPTAFAGCGCCGCPSCDSMPSLFAVVAVRCHAP